MKKSLKISKLDSVRRQIETFIRLYFHDGDPVAMHTLTAAAFGVIRDLNQKRGGEPTIHEALLVNVKGEYREMMRKKLNKAQNFFKHADRDHDSTLDFFPDSTQFVALDVCYKYTELTGEMPPLFKIFIGWMMITNQDAFTFPKDDSNELEEAAESFLPDGKTAYFNSMLPVVMQSGV